MLPPHFFFFLIVLPSPACTVMSDEPSVQSRHLRAEKLGRRRSRLVKTPQRLLSPLFHLLDEIAS